MPLPSRRTEAPAPRLEPPCPRVPVPRHRVLLRVFSFLGSGEDEERKKPKKKTKKEKKEKKEKKRTAGGEDTGAKLGEIRDGKIFLQAASNRKEWFDVDKLERQLDPGVCLPVLLHKGRREDAIKVCPHPDLPGHGDHASTFSAGGDRSSTRQRGWTRHATPRPRKRVLLAPGR